MKNLLLAGLPPHEHRRFLSKLEPIHFPKGRILYETGQLPRYAYFINSGVVSLLAVAEDGRTIQIAVVGNEGFVGVPIILMASKTPNRAVTQTPVDAIRIEADRLLAEFNRSGKLREVLLRYSQLLQIQFAQSVICNTFHTVKQRLCRLMLTISDSLGSDGYDLTQQEIADILGSHRNRAIAATRDLKKRDLIHHSYGSITILDRKGLERASCECYRIVREWTAELLDF